jgi:hypothetical protein
MGRVLLRCCLAVARTGGFLAGVGGGAWEGGTSSEGYCGLAFAPILTPFVGAQSAGVTQ